MRLYRQPKTNKSNKKKVEEDDEETKFEAEEEEAAAAAGVCCSESNVQCCCFDINNHCYNHNPKNNSNNSTIITKQQQQQLLLLRAIDHQLPQSLKNQKNGGSSTTGSKTNDTITYHYMTCDDEFITVDMMNTPKSLPIKSKKSSSFFYVGQKVWVCKSKGTKKKKTKEGTHVAVVSNEERLQQQRYELFSHATIVQLADENNKDDNDVQQPRQQQNFNNNQSNSSSCDGGGGYQHHHRTLVQYPMGSTYHVRSELLVPIFDTPTIERYMKMKMMPTATGSTNDITDTMTTSVPVVVLVYPETNLYRRGCMIHTVPNTDHFIEIGCAQGMTCHRIYTTGSNDRQVNRNDLQQQQPHPSSIPETATTTTKRRRRIVLGIDKSISCIQDAQERYGHVQSSTYTSSTTTTNPTNIATNNNSHSLLHFVTYDIFQPLSLPRTTPISSLSLSSTPQQQQLPDAANLVENNTTKNNSTNITDDDDYNNIEVHGIIQSLIDGYHRTEELSNSNSMDSNHNNVDPSDLDPTTVTTTELNDTDTDVLQHVPLPIDTLDHDDSINQTDDTTNVTLSDDNNDDNMDLVIAVDINGNRHLQPIVQCLQIIMNTRFTLVHRQQPRLIIVKSRSLYQHLQQQEQQLS